MMPVATISLSLSTFVSQNKGADQGERIRKAVHYGNLLALTWSIIILLILFFGAETMVKVLSGSSESVVIENGAKYLIVNAPFFCVLGVLLNLRNALQGIGKKVVPLVSSIIELCGKILFVIFFIPSLNYFGVIICEPVIWCFMCIQLVYAFYRNPYIIKYRKKPVLE